MPARTCKPSDIKIHCSEVGVRSEMMVLLGNRDLDAAVPHTIILISCFYCVRRCISELKFKGKRSGGGQDAGKS